MTLTLEGHPGNLPGTPPWRTRGRAGLKGICPSVRTSERWAGRGGEDAGGGRGPCTHPALVPPDLNLHGTHHFPGPPSHPENRVGPRGLPNLGQPGPPRPSARTAFHPGALGCAALPPGAAGRRRCERQASARSRLGIPGYKCSPRPTGGLRAGILTGLDGPMPLTRGQALTLSSSRRGDAYPFAGTGTGACGPAAPAQSRRRARSPGPRPCELGTHGVSCSGHKAGAEGCVPARRERPCGSDAARLFQGLNLCFIYLTQEEIVLSHDSFLSRWRLQHF